MTDRPPKVPGVCDIDGKPLVQRDDDREAVVRERLRVFHNSTEALLDYYRKGGRLVVVPAVGSIEAIYQDMMSRLNGRA